MVCRHVSAVGHSCRLFVRLLQRIEHDGHRRAVRAVHLLDAHGPDEVILAEIYEVAGREDEAQKISSKDLVRAVQERGGVDAISYTKNIEDTEKQIRKKLGDFDIILIMGAGDIDTVARNLVK